MQNLTMYFVVVHEDFSGSSTTRTNNLIFSCALFTNFFNFSFAADYEAVVKLSDGFNGADLRNVCTEAGSAFKRIIFDQSLPCLLLMY